jgi:TPR repeat protein
MLESHNNSVSLLLDDTLLWWNEIITNHFGGSQDHCRMGLIHHQCSLVANTTLCNLTKAEHYFRTAVDLGDGHALFHLGSMHQHGNIIIPSLSLLPSGGKSVGGNNKKDNKKGKKIEEEEVLVVTTPHDKLEGALYYYLQAGLYHNHSEAQFRISQLYEQRKISMSQSSAVPESKTKHTGSEFVEEDENAKLWIRKAAENGHVEAQLILAQENFNMGKQNELNSVCYSMALKWWTLAGQLVLCMKKVEEWNSPISPRLCCGITWLQVKTMFKPSCH